MSGDLQSIDSASKNYIHSQVSIRHKVYYDITMQIRELPEPSHGVLVYWISK